MTCRLLLVDDDLHIVRALTRIAESEGYVVTGTCDPRDAVQRLEGGESFEIIVSDYMMPGLNGVEVLNVARRTHSDSIRMLLTAASDFRVAVDAVNQSEVFRLIGKPWNHADLVRTFASAAETYRLRRENRMLTELVQRQNAELQVMNHHLEQLVLERTNNLLDGLITALDYRDAETQWHSRRVSLFARHLASRFITDPRELADIELGALLHDVGKIAVRDAILLKKGPLTPEEWVEMRVHPDAGWRMLQRIPYLKGASLIVYQHHERWDGRGYPNKLSGSDICIGARIFSIVDTYDSITSDRPYRAAQSHELACQEIVRCAGTQLDPELVQLFLQVPESDWLKLREQIANAAAFDLAAGVPRPMLEHA